MDIQPTKNASTEIITGDFLCWEAPKRPIIVLGNPPFGLRGNLALRFINKAADFADLVAFILPQLFDSDGKGVPAKRVDKRLKLAYSEKLNDCDFLLPDGNTSKVNTLFQVWSKVNHEKIPEKEVKTCKSFIRVYSLSDGGTPSSTRNKKMLNSCDVYLPSTCFDGMKAYKSFYELPNKRGYGVVIYKNKNQIKSLLETNKWETTAFRSTNGAYNLRTSLIESVVVEGNYIDSERNNVRSDRRSKSKKKEN